MIWKMFIANYSADEGGTGGDGGAAGAGGDASAAGGDKAGEQRKPVLTMPKEAFDARIAETRRAAVTQYEAEMRGKGLLLDEDQAKAFQDSQEAARKAEEEANKKTGRYKELYEESDKRLKAEAAEKQRIMDQSRQEREGLLLDHAVIMSLSALPIREGIPRDEIKTLVMGTGSIKVVEGKLAVVDKDGQPIYSKAAGKQSEPMQVDEFIANWLSEHPWYLPPAGKNGAGTMPNRTIIPNLPPDWNSEQGYARLSPEQKALVQDQFKNTGPAPFRWGAASKT